MVLFQDLAVQRVSGLPGPTSLPVCHGDQMIFPHGCKGKSGCTCVSPVFAQLLRVLLEGKGRVFHKPPSLHLPGVERSDRAREEAIAAGAELDADQAEAPWASRVGSDAWRSAWLLKVREGSFPCGLEDFRPSWGIPVRREVGCGPTGLGVTASLG